MCVIWLAILFLGANMCILSCCVTSYDVIVYPRLFELPTFYMCDIQKCDCFNELVMVFGNYKCTHPKVSLFMINFGDVQCGN
jgi:hypothetical protein